MPEKFDNIPFKAYYYAECKECGQKTVIYEFNGRNWLSTGKSTEFYSEHSHHDIWEERYANDKQEYEEEKRKEVASGEIDYYAEFEDVVEFYGTKFTFYALDPEGKPIEPDDCRYWVSSYPDRTSTSSAPYIVNSSDIDRKANSYYKKMLENK